MKPLLILVALAATCGQSVVDYRTTEVSGHPERKIRDLVIVNGYRLRDRENMTGKSLK